MVALTGDAIAIGKVWRRSLDTTERSPAACCGLPLMAVVTRLESLLILRPKYYDRGRAWRYLRGSRLHPGIDSSSYVGDGLPLEIGY